MSFNFYFAGDPCNEPADNLIKGLNLNLLRNYVTEKKSIVKWVELKKEGQWTGKFLVDSGAFPAWTRGIEICPDTYIEWINENSKDIDYFIQLDTIPGTPGIPPTLEESQHATESSWQNYLHMLEGVNCPERILPVFHRGEPFSHLKRIVEHQINGEYVPYICFGGTVKERNRAALMSWYHSCYEVIQKSKNPNVKVHSLGNSTLSILEKFPFCSSDSTSYIMTAAMGSIFSDYGSLLVSDRQKYSKENVEHVTPQLKQWVEDKCKQYGLEYSRLQEHLSGRECFNISYMAEWLENYQYKGPKSFIRRSLF